VWCTQTRLFLSPCPWAAHSMSNIQQVPLQASRASWTLFFGHLFKSAGVPWSCLQWFMNIDKDRSGELDVKELQSALAMGNLNFGELLRCRAHRIRSLDYAFQAPMLSVCLRIASATQLLPVIPQYQLLPPDLALYRCVSRRHYRRGHHDSVWRHCYRGTANTASHARHRLMRGRPWPIAQGGRADNINPSCPV
jgi:hypothetical protein